MANTPSEGTSLAIFGALTLAAYVAWAVYPFTESLVLLRVSFGFMLAAVVWIALCSFKFRKHW